MVLLLRHAIAALFICHELWVGEIPSAVEDKKPAALLFPVLRPLLLPIKRHK